MLPSEPVHCPAVRAFVAGPHVAVHCENAPQLLHEYVICEVGGGGGVGAEVAGVAGATGGGFGAGVEGATGAAVGGGGEGAAVGAAVEGKGTGAIGAAVGSRVGGMVEELGPGSFATPDPGLVVG